jgi:hypothetical protein
MRTVNIDDMCWPLPDEVLDHRLRYCKDQITDREKMRAAQILAAYARMVEMSRDGRQKVIAAIRLEQNQRNRWEKKQDRIDDRVDVEMEKKNPDAGKSLQEDPQ